MSSGHLDRLSLTRGSVRALKLLRENGVRGDRSHPAALCSAMNPPQLALMPREAELHRVKAFQRLRPSGSGVVRAKSARRGVVNPRCVGSRAIPFFSDAEAVERAGTLFPNPEYVPHFVLDTGALASLAPDLSPNGE